MRMYLNAGFGEPLGAETLSLIRGLGFTGIRQGAKPEGRGVPDNEDHARVLFTEIRDAGLSGLILVGSGTRDGHDAPDQVVATGEMAARIIREVGLDAAIEVINEPDDSTQYRDGRVFAHTINRVHDVSLGLPVISGGILKTEPQTLDGMARVLSLLNEGIAFGIHGYRHNAAGPHVGRGFPTRAAEFARIREVAGDRPIWCTEIGWDEWGPTPSKWEQLFGKRKLRRSQAEVLAFLREEKRMQEEAGFEVMTVFQLNDGLDRERETWGIRNLDGSLKPSAMIAQEG